ncbi:hypothetical protein [Kitasatospora sp. NPDC088346]|uniref:hypothetical protein n=1 Tax=Kitasatospora sp. NPDC088346 TaxID=3364073 RepID=UPI00381032FB
MTTTMPAAVQPLGYPSELDGDLRDCGLAEPERREILTTAWEYTRCGIPEFTNRAKYLTFARLTALTTVAEYRGRLVDVERMLRPGGRVLGYPVREMLDSVFAGTSVGESMTREYASCLLLMAAKTGGRHPVLHSRFTQALASSPELYFRLRDCDAQVRLFIAAAVACNDLDPSFTEAEYRAMSELGMSLYDAIAYHKHRAEAEVCNLYAYCGPDLEFRKAVYGAARSTLSTAIEMPRWAVSGCPGWWPSEIHACGQWCS